MTLPPWARWAAIFGIPVLVLGAYAAWAAWPAVMGESVLLSTRPVDPPDMLRGDYADLRLTIGSIEGANGYAEGERIYVVLAPGATVEPGTGNAYWEVQSHHRSRPGLERDEVCLQGTVQHAGGGAVRVRYGIESYFIPKDETLEDWRGKTVSVEAKVSGCEGRVTGIRLDGTPWP